MQFSFPCHPGVEQCQQPFVFMYLGVDPIIQTTKDQGFCTWCNFKKQINEHTLRIGKTQK